MKATLTFDLEDPGDDNMFKVHTQAKNLTLAIWELLYRDLRGLEKHEDMTIFSHEDRLYELDLKGNPVTIETKVEDISAHTMASMIRSLIFRKLKDDDINIDVLP